MARRRSMLVTIPLAALLAVACSDPPTSGSGEVATGEGGDELPECPLDALEAADGPVEIELWYGGLAGTVQQTMEDMVTSFNASQSDVVVRASDQGASYQEVYRKYESASSASKDQLPDVVYLEQTQLRALADGGEVLPAEACMEADGYDLTQIEPVARAAFEVDDVLYPGYMNVSNTVLYYNKSHWAQAGLDPEAPPETLDELHDAARAIKEAGVAEKPFVLKASHTFFTNWLSGVGVDIVNERNGRTGVATEATFDTPEAHDLMADLTEMEDEGLLNVFASTEGSIDHYLALVTQESSMLLETSTASTTIRDALAGVISADDVGVDLDQTGLDLSALVPGTGQFPGIEQPGQVTTGGGAFFILNTSEPAQQAASWRFLRFMLEPENATQWHVTGGYLPIVKAVQDEPEVQAFWETDVAGILLQPAIAQLSAADPDRPGPLIGPYVDVVDTIQQMVEDVLLNGADIDTALASAEAEATASLERYAG